MIGRGGMGGGIECFGLLWILRPQYCLRRMLLESSKKKSRTGCLSHGAKEGI